MSSVPGVISILQRLRPASSQWDLAIRQALCDLRVAVPCKVLKFNPDGVNGASVDLQPLIRENIALPPTQVSTPMDLPQLLDVLVLTPQTAGWAITFPIQPGDECLAVFSDMCTDAWELQGGVQNQIFQRRHDLSDAVAVFGLRSLPNKLSDYSTSSMQLRSRDGQTLIDISAGQVSITPDGGTTKILIKAGEIDLTATLVKINGLNFQAHVHSGVTTGGGTSGPVTP